ncbi:MAG: helix-turn-helix domain-containing protein [Candidatus Acidiferrum sp.]
MPSNMQPRMLPIKEAAAYLGATVWFVRNEVWNLRLPHVKFGNRLVFDRVDLDAYIERKKSMQ